MKIIDLRQKSSEWLQWRQTGLGSSDAAVLALGKHYQLTPEKLFRVKTGQEQAPPVNGWAVEQGVLNEPLIRDWAAMALGFQPRSVCAVSEQYPWLKASYDGWDAATGTVVEIKVIGREKQETALGGQVPKEFQPQCNHLWLATDGLAKRVVYLSYCKFVEPRRAKAVVVYRPKEEDLQKLLDLEIAFMQKIWDWQQQQIQSTKSV